MRILVLGGTVFLGRHVAAAALARGHHLTLFTRGVHGTELFPEATRLVGDRAGDLSALEEGEWDAVIDTSGFQPEHVGRLCQLLAGALLVASASPLRVGAQVILRAADAVSAVEYTLPCKVMWVYGGAPCTMAFIVDGIPIRSDFGSGEMQVQGTMPLGPTERLVG